MNIYPQHLICQGLQSGTESFYLPLRFSFAFHHLHCANLQRKSEQGDESGCVMVIVKVAGREACQRFIVKAVREVVPALDDIAL